MEQKERDMLNRIKEETQQVQVPESLSPEVMEQKISNKVKKRKWNKSMTAGLLAASLVVVCGVTFGILKNDKPEQERAEKRSAVKSGSVQMADSYEEVYECMKEYLNQQIHMAGREGNTSMSVKTAEKGASDQAPVANADYSTTNTRQEGVDEADIVKTDGTYLYVLRDGGESIAIVKADAGELKEQAEILIKEGESGVEFFIKGETLVLISGTNSWNYGVMPLDGARAGTHESGPPITKLITYDISDVSTPKKVGEVTQSGFYTTARMEGDSVYLFSRYRIGNTAVLEDKATFIPSINGNLIAEHNISIPAENSANAYEVVTSIDITKPGEIKDSRAILSPGGELYMSTEHIYWYEQNWEDHQTFIRKFSYKNGKIEGVAQGKVKGFIDDVFSIDEYNGYLRVITTYKETNGVYIFNQKMQQTGAIEGLAKEERVRSARFMGDTGYFVTFKETDPLFSVDLSDPKNPQILGALKIPGFSEYLHFYGENQLLGIGLEVDEESLSTKGVKLSMFDISDKRDVKEANKHVMEHMYSTDALYAYKAVLIDPEKNIIGFSGFEGAGEYYYVFSYEQKEGFVCVMKEQVNGSGTSPTRGVFLKDFLYVIKGNVIEQYSLEQYKKTGDFIL